MGLTHGQFVIINRLFFFLCSCPEVSCRGNPLGMEDKKISGGGIVASSWYSPHTGLFPSQGRLNNHKGSWCPKSANDDPEPYLQVRDGINLTLSTWKPRKYTRIILRAYRDWAICTYFVHLVYFVNCTCYRTTHINALSATSGLDAGLETLDPESKSRFDHRQDFLPRFSD